MKPVCLRLLPVLLLPLAVRPLPAGEVALRWESPALDRWMYPFNATPGSRPRGPVFGTLGDDAGVDTLHGQVILAFDTTNQVPAGRPLADYLIAGRSLKSPWPRTKPSCWTPRRTRGAAISRRRIRGTRLIRTPAG
ncbi:MAG TPA: hypothetical protein PKE47_05410, partial [Verrucomicrobiota bacterium]|nr:hypothetical protein [Verrucomicrobiota bacterium]